MRDTDLPAERHPGPALGGRPFQTNDGGQLIVTTPVTGEHGVLGVVRAIHPAGSVYAHLVPAWLAMLCLAALVLVAAWQLARLQARRLATPLEEFSAVAHQLGDGDFSVRTTLVGIAEIDSLGRALNGTADRLDDLLARERAFSAEASHQLRTPLAGLRLRLESALDRPDQDLRQAITAGIANADQLGKTISELLLLACESGTTKIERVDLDALVEEIKFSWTDRLAAAGRSLDCDIDTHLPRSSISAAATRQILAVLLDNAEVHGAGGVHVTIREALGAVAIDVADEGRGVDLDRPGQDDARARGPGHGLGLRLAGRLAEAEGGRLILTRPTPPVFTLLLPAE